jgi:uncharacterized protein
MPEKIELSKFHWINKPEQFSIEDTKVKMVTSPETDHWQRTYYGFQHDTSHALVLPVEKKEFSFSVTAAWEPRKLFDQCGVILYQDADNWFKASVEYDNPSFSRLGSVVTNLGYSDWATTDTDSELHQMTYRLSRRGQDFLIENASDGKTFKQMRIFHLHLPMDKVNIGVYACSPLNSSIQAVFTDFALGECQWELYENPDLK